MFKIFIYPDCSNSPNEAILVNPEDTLPSETFVISQMTSYLSQNVPPVAFLPSFAEDPYICPIWLIYHDDLGSPAPGYSNPMSELNTSGDEVHFMPTSNYQIKVYNGASLICDLSDM